MFFQRYSKKISPKGLNSKEKLEMTVDEQITLFGRIIGPDWDEREAVVLFVESRTYAQQFNALRTVPFYAFFKTKVQRVRPKPINSKNRIKIQQITYPADCRKIAAVDSNKHDWD